MKLLPARRPSGRTGPPDFVGVGTHGSGTGWWHGLLLQHPDICAPLGGPEQHFFDAFCSREMLDEDVAAYYERFPRPEGSISGEWTPRYAYDPWTPLLLSRVAPEAKLLVMVSDPVERYRARLAGARKEAEADDEPLYLVDASGRGRYAAQLLSLHRYFDPAQILVLQHEKCRIDPVGEYARTLRFLGVRDDVVPRRLRRAAKGHTGPRPAVRILRRVGLLREPELADLWPEVEASLHEELDPQVEELASLVPELDLQLWPHFAHLAATERLAGQQAT